MGVRAVGVFSSAVHVTLSSTPHVVHTAFWVRSPTCDDRRAELHLTILQTYRMKYVKITAIIFVGEVFSY